MIIGLLGKAGSGKDTVADLLAQHQQFVKLSLADPLKRICRDVFAFDDIQLWGPSSQRNRPDKRYPRGVSDTYGWVCTSCKCAMYGNAAVEEKTIGMVGPTARCAVCSEITKSADLWYIAVPEFLTPRYALQRLGTEYGRDCYSNIWIEYALRVAGKLTDGGHVYDARSGLRPFVGNSYAQPKTAVVIPDCRFKNEVEAIKRAGGVVVRVKRPGAGLVGEAAKHASEMEQEEISDDELDYVLLNNGTLESLPKKIEAMLFNFGVTLPPPSMALVPSKERPRDTSEALKDFLETIPEEGVVVEQVDGSLKELKLFNPPIQVEDGVEVLPENYNPLLNSLLEQRAKDVEAGRIREYDAAQSDVPPYKRK